MKKELKTYARYLMVFILLSQFGCRKFVQLPPDADAITASQVYSSDASAAAAVGNIYESMIQANGNTNGSTLLSLSMIGGLSADELKNYLTSNAILQQCYTNSLQSTTSYFWTGIFNGIYGTNDVLSGLASNTGVTPAEKQQLNGEAYFMRAFLHFYGTNIFGNFPIVTTTNYKVNNTISRSSQTLVYQQVMTDLKTAKGLLPANFVEPTGQIVTTERVRPTKWAAMALLARVYLYQKDWADADAMADSVINNTSLFSLVTNLNDVFLANSNEAIWQIQPVVTGYNTFDAFNFILTSTPGSGTKPAAMSNNLVNAFEPGDQRFVNWVGSFISQGVTYYYPYKYKIGFVSGSTSVSEYLMIFRLAEQYLIRAEAEANGATGGLNAAIADLNLIRTRAGLPNYTGSATDKTAVLNAIYHEDQVEFFTELGHRWFDLQRWGMINSVMGSPGNVTQSKGGSWNPDGHQALFPVPQTQILLDGNLGQNPGY